MVWYGSLTCWWWPRRFQLHLKFHNQLLLVIYLLLKCLSVSLVIFSLWKCSFCYLFVRTNIWNQVEAFTSESDTYSSTNVLLLTPIYFYLKVDKTTTSKHTFSEWHIKRLSQETVRAARWRIIWATLVPFGRFYTQLEKVFLLKLPFSAALF